MNEQHYRSAIKHAPFAYAHHKIILGRNGTPEDFIFLEVNSEYERITGHKSEDISGRSIKEVEPGIEDLEFDWIGLCGEIALKGGSRFSDHLWKKNGNWYRVKVFSEKKMYFSVIFTDITDQKLIENQKNKEESRFRLIFRNAPLGILHFNKKGIITDCNDVFISIIGSSRKALIGLDMFELPDKRVVNAVKTTLEGKKASFNGIYESTTADKSTPVNVLFAPILPQGGSVDGGIGIVEDVTEQWESEQKLRESEQKYRQIADNISDVVFTLDLELNFTYISPSIKKLTDLAPEKYAKLPLKDKYPPGSLKKIRNALRRELEREKDKDADPGRSIILELEHYKPGGSVMHVSMNLSFLRDENQKAIGILGVSRDITERKIMEQQLEYQLEFQKLISRISSDFVSVNKSNIDSKINSMLEKIGLFFKIDRTYLFNFSRDYETMSNTHEWCAGGITPVMERLQDMPVSALPWWREEIFCLKPVHIPDVEALPPEAEAEKKEFSSQGIRSLLTVPICDGDKLTGFFGFDSVREKLEWDDRQVFFLRLIANILEDARKKVVAEEALVQAKEKAEESDRLKSAFLANVSHEIRTPMNGILGFLELLKSPELDSRKKDRYIDIVNLSGQRLLNTINDIVEISKIESGQTDIVLTDVNLPGLMQYTCNFFSQQADRKGIWLKLNKRCGKEVSVVRTDINKLESILGNLLNNAVKFTSKGGIEFGCRRVDDMIEFFVRDTGAGIDKDRIDAVFDRFVQADLSFNRNHEGSGLGLSIAKAYTGMLGGKIWAESKPGKGSTFFFTIPYTPTANTALKTETEDMSTNDPISGKLILVAEDDELAFQYIDIVLKKEGMNTIWSRNGEDTIKLLKENPDVSLILMDIKMPGMNGLEATREIRNFNSEIPIIAQTAHALEGDRERSLEAGCDDYISKPIGRERLIEKVKKQLRK